MSRTLVVMRHAKSSWKTNDSDLRRPLSRRGSRDAVVAGNELAGTRFDVVLCSPAARVAQTWELLSMSRVSAAEMRVEDAIYHGGTDAILDLLRALPADAARVLVIGHEPTVSDLVLELAGPSTLRRRIEQKFPTCAMAVLTHTAPWSELGEGSATLAAFEVPRG